jgi:23S rRNA (guanosine2251-2'-O)-methyltransferase
MRKNNSIVKIYGRHAVLDALSNHKRSHKEIFTTQNVYFNHKATIDSSGAKLLIKLPKELDLLAPDAVHQNIILHTSSIMTRDTTHLQNIIKKDRSVIIALDQVTDPQNVGAIIRSALAFNVDAILLPEHATPDETPSLAKAAAGAIEKLPIIKITNLVNTIKLLKKNHYWAIGLDSNTKNLVSNYVFDKKILLILGSEGKGLRPLTIQNCDSLIKLPISKSVESLNVSNAAAIAMYEAFKQGL